MKAKLWFDKTYIILMLFLITFDCELFSTIHILVATHLSGLFKKNIYLLQNLDC